MRGRSKGEVAAKTLNDKKRTGYLGMNLERPKEWTFLGAVPEQFRKPSKPPQASTR